MNSDMLKKVEDAAARGLTQKEAASELGINYKTLNHMVIRHGVKFERRGKNWRKDRHGEWCITGKYEREESRHSPAQ